jgi:RNA polymerase sigma factor (sigma-70 family)
MNTAEGTLFYNSILSRIQGKIEAQARTLYFRTRNALSVSLDDLIQEGMIGAWKGSMNYDESKVTNEHSLDAYCMKYAKGAMLQHIQKQKPELSLEEHLEVETERGLVQRDIEDKPVKSAETPEHKRQFVMNALSTISPRRRIVIMAAFQIEDEQGKVTTKEDIGISDKLWYDAKMMGLRKLRTITSIEDLQFQNDKPNLREECRKLLRQDPTMKPRFLMQLTGCSKTNAAKARAELKLRASAVS